MFNEEETQRLESVPKGVYEGQIGITIRFGNHFWYECCGTLLEGAQGDNMATVVIVKKQKKNKTPIVTPNSNMV